MELRRKVIPEDLFKIKAVSDPQISPDGLSIAYVETRMERDTNQYSSRIWLVSGDGAGEPWPLTSGPGLDFSPRWSPDGKFIAFISTRAGSKQLWLLPSSGGQAILLSAIRHVEGAPVWSPDSEAIACIVRLRTEREFEQFDQEQSPRERFLKDVLVIDELRYKLDTVGFLVNKRWHLFIIQAVGPERGKYRQLTYGNYNFSSPAWSPDGRYLAVSGNRLPVRENLDLVNDIWIVPYAGGTPRRLTRSTGPAQEPVWSPDGRQIAYLGHDRRRGYYTNRGIWIVPIDGGRPKELTAGFRYPVGDYAIKDILGYSQPGVAPHWSPDGQSIYMNVSERGAVHLWRFPATEGKPTQMTFGDLVIYNLSFTPDMHRAAMAVTTPTLPGDIWICDMGVEGIRERRLTSVNGDWLNRVAVTRPARFSFRSADGTEGDGWMLYPSGAGTDKYPVILEIHGGPTVMYGYVFFFEFQYLASHGFAVVYTNPRGSMGYGEEFAAAIRGDWGNLDFADLMAAVDASLLQGESLDADRLGIAGGSYGGYMTNWIVTQSNRFKAAVSMRGISNLYSFFGTSDEGYLHAEEFGGAPWQYPDRYLIRSPISYAANVRTPLLIIHSDNDFRVPIEQGEQFFTALKFLHRDVRMVRFLTESHELSRGGEPWHRVLRLEHILNWFEKFLKMPKT